MLVLQSGHRRFHPLIACALIFPLRLAKIGPVRRDALLRQVGEAPIIVNPGPGLCVGPVDHPRSAEKVVGLNQDR